MRADRLAWIHFSIFLIITGIVIVLMRSYPLASIIRIGSYLFFLNLITSILIGNQKLNEELSLIQRIGKSWLWPLRWHLIVATLGIVGGILGALVFAIVGSLFDIGSDISERLLNGFKDGAYYFLIWSPGGAIVLLIIWAHQQKKNLHREGS